MAVEHSIFSISEEKVAGRVLISSEEMPRVRITMTQYDDGIREYAVRGFVPLERSAISAVMQQPIGDEDYTWQQTRDGLRNVGRPSQKIAKLSRSALHSHQLNEVKDSATELANILANNQDYSVKTASMPVFNYAEAQQYAADVLYTKTSERKLLGMLKSLGLDPILARHLHSIISSAAQTPDAVKELESITGIGLADRTSAQNQALLGEVNSTYATELIHRLQYDLFVGFPQQSRFEEGKLVGGSDDLTVLLRESDIPVTVPIDFTNVRVATPKVGVSLSEELRDKDRKTGLSRQRVTFYTEMERQVAAPLLSWRIQKSKREFIFPVSTFEQERHGIARPSSLIGVALVAGAIGHEMGVNYARELQSRLRYAPRGLGRAGLFPLVATFREQDILTHPYFEAIENLL